MASMNLSNRPARINSVAVIGNHMPRQCGIATFTTDLCDALAGELDREGRVEALAMDDLDGGYAYPPRVTFQIRANTPTDYRQAVDYINVKQFDLVILQHEYGIFGGPYGAHILSLIKNLSMPVITTLHTVLEEPTDQQKSIMMELARYSDRLVVMSGKADEILARVYDIPPQKVAHIPHGIFDVPFIDPSFYKDSFGVEGRKVILTFGLLSPGKGIEYAIEAMPSVIDTHPDAVYIILGATHPHIKRTKGEAYRHSLQQRVVKLGLENNVMFHNRFVPVQLLVKYIGASDLYVTPYLSRQQITSGTLAYALGTGKAVVSTPYWYAEELLADGRGVLVPFRDSEALGESIAALLGDDVKRNAMRKKAYQWCRPMIWKEVARRYLTLAGEVVEERIRTPKPRPVITTTHEDLELPEVDLKHLRTLTDDTGIISHGHFATPDRSHGYRLADNALALVSASMTGRTLQDTSMTWLMQRYLAFLYHAWDRKHTIFRDQLSYERLWQQRKADCDAVGRALWALGCTVRCAEHSAVQDIATRLFSDALPAADRFSTARPMAYALIGAHSYLEVYGGDASVRRIRNQLAKRLYELFPDSTTASGNGDRDAWLWCSDTLEPDSARTAQALLLAGQWIPEPKMFELGIRLLRWLVAHQTAPDGHATIVGSDDYMTRTGKRSNFEQLPSETMSLVGACAEAYRATRQDQWLKDAQRFFGWFIGRNDLQMPIYDFKTGGCRDGLLPHGPNENEGAEATCSWLISLLTLTDIAGQKVLDTAAVQVPAAQQDKSAEPAESAEQVEADESAEPAVSRPASSRS